MVVTVDSASGSDTKQPDKYHDVSVTLIHMLAVKRDYGDQLQEGTIQKSTGLSMNSCLMMKPLCMIW